MDSIMDHILSVVKEKLYLIQKQKQKKKKLFYLPTHSEIDG